MIKVQATDGGIIEVGGDFARALSMVKSLPVARFDGTRKVWTVQATAAEIARTCTTYQVPCDLPSGDHRTRYGNGYTRHEWEAQAAMRKAETQVRDEMRPAEDAAAAWLDEQLSAYCGSAPAAQVVRIRRWIVEYELEEAIEMGDIRFRSDARRDELLAIVRAYEDRMGAITEEALNREQAAREHIEQEYGED